MSAAIFQDILSRIQSARSSQRLDEVLLYFREQWRRGALSPAETNALVEAGKLRRASFPSLQIQSQAARSQSAESAFSEAEKKRESARELLARAQVMSVGKAPGPSPHALPNEERELYFDLMSLDPARPGVHQEIERLELRYIERERSPEGQKLIGGAFEKKMKAISACHDERVQRAKEEAA